MCGIAGALGTDRGDLVRDMVRALAHRGPDGEGFHHAGDLHLGARRLAVVDLEGGGQPFPGSAGRCLVFNGEIYNCGELRKDLQHRGRCLATRSDTEVVLALYEEHGEDCVEHLRGMFAFAVADGGDLFLARDRLGIKPLFYTLLRGGRLLLFASEIKALLRCPEVPASLDFQAFADSLLWGHPVGRRTFFSGIHALPPGSTLRISPDPEGGPLVLTERRYHRLSWEVDEKLSFLAARRRLDEALRTAVASHLEADVEVGLTLSGGLDSSLLARLAAEHPGPPLRTYSLADHADHPDLRHANGLAELLGTLHRSASVSFDEFFDAIPGCVAAEEQPGNLLGLPLYLLFQRAGREVKVCLNGEGADELFGGYPEYLSPGYLTRGWDRRLEVVKRLGLSPSPEITEACEALTTAQSWDAYLARLFPCNLGETLVRNHLELVDHYAMAAGVECRVPYLDDRLVAIACSLPLRFKVDPGRGLQKRILKSLARSLDAHRLRAIAARPKLGLPAAGARHLAALDMLLDQTLPSDYLDRHELGFCFPARRHLLLFELFEEIFFRRRGTLPDSFDMVDFLRERARG